MIKFNNFYFENFEFDLKTKIAKFIYSFDKKVYFEEKIYFFDNNFSLRNDIDLNIINNILFHIHLALWISYYKIYPTKNLIIETWKINDFQKQFWKKFYINWLWEYLYKNNITNLNLFNFLSSSDKNYTKIDFSLENKSLVPIWWWKDSIVSIELLKKYNFEFDLFTFSSKDNILYENTQNNSWKKRLFIRRELSKNILEYNSLWAYNWHVPITWMIAFVMQLVW